MGSGKCRFCRLSSVGLGENRVLSPNKFGNHWVEQNHLDTSFYCQTSHGDDYATGCLGSLGGARLCGISQTYLSTEPFPGKAAVRFVFRRACLPTFRKLNGSQDHSVPSPPASWRRLLPPFPPAGPVRAGEAGGFPWPWAHLAYETGSKAASSVVFYAPIMREILPVRERLSTHKHADFKTHLSLWDYE